MERTILYFSESTLNFQQLVLNYSRQYTNINNDKSRTHDRFLAVLHIHRYKELFNPLNLSNMQNNKGFMQTACEGLMEIFSDLVEGYGCCACLFPRW